MPIRGERSDGSPAWLLTQDDLDRLPRVYRDDPLTVAREPITAAAVAPDEEEPLNLGGFRAPVERIAPGRPVLSGEEYRPHPAANAWPDDAVTVTYGELRKLVALHLDTLAVTMGKVAPWEDARRVARAMRDGEIPLLLSEVLDR